MTKQFTHKQIVDIGYRWLLKHSSCQFAVKEFSFSSRTGEQPDVLGFWQNASVLLEAKVSRADFLCDKKKHFRINPELGLGRYRFYICPAGLIQIDELPFNWGLIWVDEKGFAQCVKKQYSEYFQGIKTNHGVDTTGFEIYNKADETSIFYSLLRRLKPKEIALAGELEEMPEIAYINQKQERQAVIDTPVFKICSECNTEFELDFGVALSEKVSAFQRCPHCNERNDSWISIKLL